MPNKMNASKENTEKAISIMQSRSFEDRSLSTADDDARAADTQFIVDFLNAAKAKLPSEQSYKREQERRAKKNV